MTETRSYKEDLLKALTDPLEAREYLNAALEDEDPDVFMLAVQDVFEANQNLISSAKISSSDCKNDSQLNSIRNILKQIGFKLAVEVN